MIDLILAYAAGFVSALVAVFGVLYWVSKPEVMMSKDDAAYKAERRELFRKIYERRT